MSVHWHSYPAPQQAAEACANAILGLLEEALSGESTATLALSGGTTPKLMFPALAASKLAWANVHFFWVDERAVPPADPQSNYRLAEELLIHPAHIPKRNIHRIPAELRPEVAAARYAAEIREFFGLDAGELPHFDVMQRGIGADGHTASLFPGEPLIDDREQISAAVWVEKLGQWRITLLPGPLLAAKHTVMLATGGDKAGAIRAVFHEEYDPKQYPAQMASHHGRRVTWFLDEAAASLMD